MELGTLAEWVTGISNVVAVCIALFLPMYQSRKEKRTAKRRIKTIANETVNDLLLMLKNNPNCDITKTDTFENYHLLTTISAITDSDTINTGILKQIQTLLINHQNHSIQDIKLQVDSLLNKL